MKNQSINQWLGILFLMSVMLLPRLSAAPVDGDKFLFIGEGNVVDYASDFASLVNNDPSLSITITAEGYSSSAMVDDYYRDRHFESRTTGTPTELNNTFTTKLGEDFDYIIIFGKPTNLDNYPALFLESVYLINDWIRWHQKPAKIILAGIWDGSNSVNRGKMNQKLYRIGDAMETDIAPAHLAWNDIINDPSIGVSHTALSSHTGETRYTLAASLFAYYFERPTANATFSLSGLSGQEKSAIDTHAYNNWVKAQNTTQYTGEYEGSYYRPGQFPIGSHNKAALSAVAFQTSTEHAIVGTMGYHDGTNVRSWVGSSSQQQVLGNNKFDLMLIRWNLASSVSTHQQWISWSRNPNINFVGYMRHEVGGGTDISFFPNQDLLGIDTAHRNTASYNGWIRSEMGDNNYGWSIPVREGFGRFIEQRLKSAPYANDAPVYWGEHMGRYYEGWMASMLYILAAGEKPAYKPEGWTRTTSDNVTNFVTVITAADWNFGIDQAYEMMMQYGKLEGANGEVIPARTNYAPLALAQSLNVDQNTTSDIFIPLIASDKELSPLSFSIVTPPTHGSVTINGAIVTYTPDPSYNSGSDDFTFKANDGSLDSNTATVSITVGSFTPAPEINVLGDDVPILDGSAGSLWTAFPEIIVQQAIGSTRTFTILNSGLADLDLSAPAPITVTGVDAADFIITQQPTVDPLTSNASTTFEVKFLASSIGTKNAVIHIASNDADEADFNFAISGVANAVALEYLNTSFQESSADDGSIENSPVVINLFYDTFTGANGRDLIVDGDVTVSNLPQGLVASITKMSDTQVSVTLSGSTTYHEASQSVDTLTFTFLDSAFATYPSAGITNYNRSDLEIVFTGDLPYVGNSNDSGAGSLRRVVANALPGSTVLFLPLVNSVNLTTAPVLIDKNLTIDGGNVVAIDGGSVTSHFRIARGGTAGISVTLKNLALNNAKNTTNGLGGSIYSLENLILEDCSLSNNRADINGENRGGAILSRGNLTVNRCVFNNNQAQQSLVLSEKRNAFGGAIDQVGFTLTIDESQFTNNQAVAMSYQFATTGFGNGGALYLSDVGSVMITHSKFENNVATSVGSTKTGDANGGAIYCEYVNGDGDLTIDQSTFSGNSSATAGNSYGGAFYVSSNLRSSTVTLKNTTFSGNDTGASREEKASYGGAVFANLVDADPLSPTSFVSIHNSTIAANSAVAATTTSALGGGVFVSSGSINLESTLIGDNTAQGEGQDVNLQSAGVLTATYSLIESSDGSHGLIDGVNNNIIGQDALLGSLAENGGPTPTIALLTGSPAIDTGSNSLSLVTDQRGVGFSRSFGAGVDMGAFELSSGTFGVWSVDSSLTGGDALGDADPDGDGVANLLEYLVDSDPLSSGVIKINPSINGAEQLSMHFQSLRALEPSDLIVTLEGSNDLGLTDPWVAVPAVHSVSGAGPYVHQWQQSTSLDAGGKSFLRIRITQQ